MLKMWLAGEFKPRWTVIELAFGGLFIAGLLSLINAVDMWRGVSELKKFFLIIVFWLPFWPGLKPSEQRRLMGLLVASGALVGIIGATNTIWKMATNAWDFRSSGFFSMSITFGETQALFLLLTLSWLRSESPDSPRRLHLKGAAVCQAIGLLSSFTRGAFIGFALGLIMHFRAEWRKTLAGLLVIGVLAVVGAHILRPDLDVFSLKSNKPQSIGGNLRWTIWQNGWKMFTGYPVFGVGLNNIKPQYRALLEAHPNPNDPQVYGHLHNNFLQFLVMTGITGFVAFCFLFLATASFLRRLPGTISTPWLALQAYGALDIWVAFYGTGLTEYSFGDEEVAMLAFFLIGLLSAPSTSVKQLDS
ncbi:MAG TPA: O-antigen ligase family protein [Candidatus Ozemobacteraceae bacterium]|nr:O-antigen ligase family protein [Candidatus Ozemobacteraceae bacterium]